MATPLALVWDLLATDNASAVFKKVGAEAGAASKETAGLGAGFAKMGGVLALAGAALTVVAVKMAVDMQESTAKIQGNAQITQKAAVGIGDAFLATAGHSTFSGKAMSDAFGPVSGVIQSLSGHTLTVADSMNVMAAATTLAEASGKPLKETTADLAAVMQNYGLKVKDAAEVSNTLFNASRLTNIDLDTLTATVDKLHGKLGIASPSLADTSSLLVDLANHGISGSKGVLVVNSALTSLLSGSKGSTAELKTLGVHVFDVHGKFVGMQGVLEQLTPKLKNMSDKQRLAAESALFGSGAAKAMNSTIMAGVDGFNKSAAAVTKHGAAETAAKAASETLGGQMKTLRAAFADIVTILGEKLIPVITNVVTWMSKHKVVVEILAGVIVGVMAAAIGVWIVGLGAATVALFSVGGALAFVTWPIALVVAGIALLAAGLIYAYKNSETFRTVVDTAFHAIQVVIGKVVSVVIELFRHMLGAWTTVVGGLLSAAATIAEKLHLPFADSMRKASNAFNDMAKAADNKLKSVADSASHWGEQTGKNFTAGIGGQLRSAADMATLMGAQVARGFASGIAANSALASMAAASMAGQAQAAMAANLRPPTARALGGPVMAGQSYIVGENRPELFVPSQNGMILPQVPHGGAGGSGDIHVTVNSVLDGQQVGRSVVKFSIAEARRNGTSGIRS